MLERSRNSFFFTFKDFAKIKNFPKANVNTQIVPAQDPDIKMPITSQGCKDSPLGSLEEQFPKDEATLTRFQTWMRINKLTNLKPGQFPILIPDHLWSHKENSHRRGNVNTIDPEGETTKICLI